MKILAINGSYRDDGITDQSVDTMVQALEATGADVETVQLREYPIKFCLNCRECTQQLGENPGRCVLDDGLNDLVTKIEQADGYILASPTNFGSVTASFKRLMERLIVYAYWPWGNHAPKFRKAKLVKKKALLITSSAAPGILGRLLYTTLKQLKMTAKVIGAKPVGTFYTGLAAEKSDQQLVQCVDKKISILVSKLIQS